MVNPNRLELAIDRSEIENLIAKSIISRDSGMWEALAECYTPDATLTSSWYSGSPADFLEQAGKMRVARHEGEAQKHMTANHWIEVNGGRAISESDLILYQRRLIDAVELDFTTWSRRLHLFEKRDGEWKIRKRWSIYEKDRMDPHNRGELPEGFYESMDLTRYPKEIRYHCWRNDMAGFPPAAGICVKGSEREREVRAEVRSWIEAR
jgi:hypothetical protein